MTRTTPRQPTAQSCRPRWLHLQAQCFNDSCICWNCTRGWQGSGLATWRQLRSVAWCARCSPGGMALHCRCRVVKFHAEAVVLTGSANERRRRNTASTRLNTATRLLLSWEVWIDEVSEVSRQAALDIARAGPSTRFEFNTAPSLTWVALCPGWPGRGWARPGARLGL